MFAVADGGCDDHELYNHHVFRSSIMETQIVRGNADFLPVSHSTTQPLKILSG